MANINPNERVQIKNTRDWTVAFGLIDQPGKSLLMKPHAVMRVPYLEVEYQAQRPGSFFYGCDGLGTNAAIQIVDSKVRAQVFGVEPAKAAPAVLDAEAVKKLLEISPIKEFEKAVKGVIVSDGDKRMLARLAIEAGLNEVAGGVGKKKFIEDYTGYAVIESEHLDMEAAVTTHAPIDI